MYSPIYDLRNERPMQDLWICWKQPIHDFPLNERQIKVDKTSN